MWLCRGAALLFPVCLALAQNEAARPSFEAASVKPLEQGRLGPGSLRGGPGTDSPGLLSGGATVKALLMRAYELKGYQISGPAWMESERYEIAAKIPAGAGKPEVALMLQSLLADRFHLSAHRETRELPVYALLVGKNGPKFHASAVADANAAAGGGDGQPLARRAVPKLVTSPDGFPELAPGSEVPRTYEVVVGGPDGLMHKLWARRETMQLLADRLSGQLNRAVLDRTGLAGRYDFALSWTMESAGGIVSRSDPPPDVIEMQSAPVLTDPGLSVFTTLQTQLGLRLEQTRGPLQMLVVDSVEKVPTAN